MAQGLSTSLSPRSSEAPPKLNAVPHEVEVVVTGARPGRASSNRELFTETTTTVLVFENGAVIRLGAAVQTGQLLFVTHPKFKREVIAQVTRKRDSRPSSCYVELEFSEAFPGFWGVEFPKTGGPASVAPAQKGAEELVEASELTEDTSQPPAPAPNLEEVVALKEEVEALRRKLKQVESQSENAAPASSSKSLAVEPGNKPEKAEEPIASEQSESAGSRATNSELSPTEEAMLPKVALKFGVAPQAAATPKSDKAQKSKASGSAPSNSTRVILLIAAVLVVGIGAAYFEHWIPWPAQGKPAAKVSAAPAPKIPPAAMTTPVSTAASITGNRALSGDPAANKPDSSVAINQAIQPANSPGSAPVAPNALDAQRSPAANSAVVAEAEKTSAVQPPSSGKPGVVNTVSKRPILRAPIESNSVTAAATDDSAGFMPPKLVKATRPNSPAEALQGFISGNVVLDALVDPTGHVKSTKIVSGPEKLRKAAQEAIREYKYEPAMQNGKPVPAHVNVTVQFWYEP